MVRHKYNTSTLCNLTFNCKNYINPGTVNTFAITGIQTHAKECLILNNWAFVVADISIALNKIVS